MELLPHFYLKSVWILLVLLFLVWVPVLNETLWVVPGLVSYRLGIAEGPSGSAKFGYIGRAGFSARVLEVENGCQIDPQHPPECTGSIILVQQGNCTARALVSMYELLGAKGVLIASEKLVDETQIYSNGHHTVSIPSVRVGQVVAERIRAKGTAQFLPILEYGPSLAVSVIFSVMIIVFLVGLWGGFGTQAQSQEGNNGPGSPKAKWRKRVKHEYTKLAEV